LSASLENRRANRVKSAAFSVPFLQTNFHLLFSWGPGDELCVEFLALETAGQVLNLINIMHKRGKKRRRVTVSYDCKQDRGHKTESLQQGGHFQIKKNIPRNM
jgi:hypothetical protein